MEETKADRKTGLIRLDGIEYQVEINNITQLAKSIGAFKDDRFADKIGEAVKARQKEALWRYTGESEVHRKLRRAWLVIKRRLRACHMKTS